MSKKAKAKAAEEPEAEAAGESEAPPARKKPPLLAIGVGAVAFLLSGAAAFLLTPGPKPSKEASQGEDHGAEKKDGHGEKKKDGHGAAKKETKHKDKGHADKDAAAPPVYGQFTVAGDTGFFLPDAFVVSLEPGSGVKHLKISLAIEAPPETASLYEEKSLHLRDVMTTYLRAVDIAALRNPAGMPLLRQQLRRRVEYVVSPENVKDVLILDFILT
jgi:flagellar FliL protein